mmetsp:Transcript_12805/g.31180  ORF Transcript_12805/g.31180 Transcript_12805/m.31180 type:complete len:426 (+) Transcript_12805:749-2026(+)|eukprot:CAMPEP_0178985580 /NCGR_PEP_ID=MMETSP0795-20121207/2229_1 /TAXON_ID=88552 /ORGANISM="Amoebophrya sp., Strain Ameob2" /LENGTH=425 /DNA_ID=CAMNT_0020676549 /DNA_START=633 /DNA_END=1910 /DNA_ORIENTATION=+
MLAVAREWSDKSPDVSTTYSTPELLKKMQDEQQEAAATPAASPASLSQGKGNQKKGEVKTTVIHHHPPKETMHEVGEPPANGGQTLLIAYFPWEATEEDVHTEFSKFCAVKRVHLVLDKNNTRPRCFGFVKFESPEDAKLALEATKEGKVCLNDSREHVWHLKAEWAKTGDMVDDDKWAGGGPQGGKTPGAGSSQGKASYGSYKGGGMSGPGAKGGKSKGKGKSDKGHKNRGKNDAYNSWAVNHDHAAAGVAMMAASEHDPWAAAASMGQHQHQYHDYYHPAAGAAHPGAASSYQDQLALQVLEQQQNDQYLMYQRLQLLSQTQNLNPGIAALLRQQAQQWGAAGGAGSAGGPLAEAAAVGGGYGAAGTAGDPLAALYGASHNPYAAAADLGLYGTMIRNDHGPWDEDAATGGGVLPGLGAWHLS